MLLFLYKSVEKLVELMCLEVFKLFAIFLEKVTGDKHLVTFIPNVDDLYAVTLPYLKIERVF